LIQSQHKLVNMTANDALSNPENQYFPNPEDIAVHATAFIQLMFAYSAFEAEIRSLQNTVTNNQAFGETPGNDWNARKRPKCMARLINENLPGFRQAAQIETLLKEAIPPSDQRNVLVHGEWWCFNKQKSVVTVRSGKKRLGEEQHYEFKAADIEKLVETFSTLEIELYKIRRQIENNRDALSR
jgi:hypothetical protein